MVPEVPCCDGVPIFLALSPMAPERGYDDGASGGHTTDFRVVAQYVAFQIRLRPETDITTPGPTTVNLRLPGDRLPLRLVWFVRLVYSVQVTRLARVVHSVVIFQNGFPSSLLLVPEMTCSYRAGNCLWWGGNFVGPMGYLLLVQVPIQG